MATSTARRHLTSTHALFVGFFLSAADILFAHCLLLCSTSFLLLLLLLFVMLLVVCDVVSCFRLVACFVTSLVHTVCS